MKFPNTTLKKIYAHLSCSDLDTSSSWFEKFFERPYDESPMEGLHEWHYGEQAGFQLFHDPEKAGVRLNAGRLVI